MVGRKEWPADLRGLRARINADQKEEGEWVNGSCSLFSVLLFLGSDPRRSAHAVRADPRAISSFLWTDGLPAAFARADADAVLQRQDEDLAIANLTRLGSAGGMHNGLDGRLDE